METVTQCPVCSGTQFKNVLTCKDYLVSQHDFVIQECQQCSFRLTNPRPDSASIGTYYKSDQYISHNDSGKGLISTAYRTVRNYTLRSKLNLITTLNKGKGSILDVGCGTGAFLETCKNGGWQIMGMEPDPEARTKAIDKLKVPIQSSLEDIDDAHTYDIISLWHVLEHIADIEKAITKLYSLLSENGTLLIAVPNSASYDAMYFQQYWAAYDLPRHLHHFTPSTIQPLFNKHGFKLADRKPMLFDAFYIAMLSTKYQTGKTDYVKSVQVGLQSNLKARQSGQYSSISYLFKKAQ
ncbi:class I SAM-dependent methyltransferase [Spirosoma fluminis]